MTLYQKYRPNDFDEMIGNESIIENLKKLIEKKDIHVFLFIGPSGCGKTTAARICTKKLGVDKLSIMEINSSNNRGIDTARQIIEQTKSYPINGLKWSYILDEIHRCTIDFSNSLLKILEDTPSYVYFFLCTTNPERLLPALKNRCQIIKFPPLSEKSLTRLLRRINRKEDGKANNDTIDKIVSLSIGSARKALVLLEKIINEEPDRALKILKEGRDIENKKIIDLCRVLIDTRSSWEDVTDILNELKTEEPENIRYAILGYMSGVLLKGKKNNRAAVVMEFFQEPFYNSKFYGVVLACYQSLFSG
jgi:DNA polymerase-3 subunit gamma/tau